MSLFLQDEIITTDKYLQAFPEHYFKTDCILNNKTIIWRNKTHHPPEINRNIIISGHSDYAIDDKLVSFYKPKIWYTVNKQTNKPNVFSLPLGITNNTNETALHKIYGDLDCMVAIMNEPKNDKNLVYMNFNVNTHFERNKVFQLFNNKEWVTKGDINNTMQGRTSFLRDIRNHTFVLCPRGNGIDTHRLWETLYMSSIPIVKRDIGIEDFYDLPICFIDSWEDITLEFLENEKIRIFSTVWNLEKLKVSYWINKIKSTVTN